MLLLAERPQPGVVDGSGIEAELRAAVAEKVGAAKFGLWFGDDVRLGVEGDSLEVGVPTGFFREWIKGHFAGSLIEAAEAVVGRPLKLAFTVEGEPAPPPADTSPKVGAAGA